MYLFITTEGRINFNRVGNLIADQVTGTTEPVHVVWLDRFNRAVERLDIDTILVSVLEHKGDVSAIASCTGFVESLDDEFFFSSSLPIQSSEALGYPDSKGAWIEVKWTIDGTESRTLPARIRLVKSSGDGDAIPPIDATVAARVDFWANYLTSIDGSIALALDSMTGILDLSVVGGGGGVADPTGTVKSGVYLTIPTGWLECNNDTIGSPSSGATHVSAGYSTLYELLWNAMPNTTCPVSTGRGTSAAADFAANKTIGLPDLSRNVIAGRSAGSLGGVTAILGALGGSQTHVLTVPELPGIAGHTHSFVSANHQHRLPLLAGSHSTSFGVNSVQGLSNVSDNNTLFTEVTTTAGVTDVGGGIGGTSTPHNNVQPFMALVYIIKT